MNVKRIALFASGSGTNAENIIRYFSGNEYVEVDSMWSNKKDAYALERAQNWNVETFVFTREQFYRSNEILDILNNRNIDLIVLAGFLWLIPANLIQRYTIINIHPALLPKYGGKGMFGMNVHKAVVDNGDSESGISIHYVDEVYDNGTIIFQARCPVLPSDSPEDVASKVHQLEYEHFPKVIENMLRNEV
jgi:phosphoribosylglycinamide formyltransferase-1